MAQPLADLTWPALLAHWTDFAQASVGLPRGIEGDRWRAAVAPIIGLQAVTFALGDLDRLAHSRDPHNNERALALDRAGVLVERNESELRGLWSDEPPHPEVEALIADARRALAAAREAGVEWTVADERLVAEHPAELVEALLSAGFAGDLFVPSPGIPLFERSPAAFARGPHGGAPDDAAVSAIAEFLGAAGDVVGPAPVPGPRQVYRQFDFAVGRAVRDIVVPAGAEVPGGQPLLVPATLRGEARPVALPPRRGAEVGALPVVFG